MWVELMAGKIQKLAAETINVLKLAACIGNEFDLQTTSIVHEKPPAATAADLWEALEEGLILGASDLGFITDDLETESPQSINSTYKFLHDRVQQAAYSLIREGDKKDVHLKIGRLLLENTPEHELEEKIFDIVNQLNVGTDFIIAQEERYKLARLNLIAGQKAKAATAYEPALRYLTAGSELLVADSWQTHYDLPLALNMERAECEYLTGNFGKADNVFNLILKNAQTNLDKARVYHIKELLYTNMGQLKEVIEAGIVGLKLLGLDLPTTPSQEEVDAEIERVKLNLGDENIPDLIHLPEMTDRVQLTMMGLLMELIVAAWWTNKDLFYWVTAKMVNLSLTYGNADASAFGYDWYGLILGSGLGDYRTAYEFGELSLKLTEKFLDFGQILPP